MNDREWCPLPPPGAGTLGLKKKIDLMMAVSADPCLWVACCGFGFLVGVFVAFWGCCWTALPSSFYFIHKL